MRLRCIGVSGIALTVLALITTAYADIAFIQNLGGPLTSIQTTSGQPPAAPCLTPTSLGCSPIIGRAGNSPADILFTSTTDTLTELGGAQGIGGFPVGSLIHSVTISTPGFGFTVVEVNPEREVPGQVTYTVTSCMKNVPVAGSCGDVEVVRSNPFTLSGNNRVAVVASHNELIEVVTVNSVSGFLTLKQPRTIADEITAIDVIPEPSSMLLVGSGLLVFTQVLRRKLKHGFGTRSA